MSKKKIILYLLMMKPLELKWIMSRLKLLFPMKPQIIFLTLGRMTMVGFFFKINWVTWLRFWVLSQQAETILTLFIFYKFGTKIIVSLKVILSEQKILLNKITEFSRVVIGISARVVEVLIWHGKTTGKCVIFFLQF